MSRPRHVPSSSTVCVAMSLSQGPRAKTFLRLACVLAPNAVYKLPPANTRTRTHARTHAGARREASSTGRRAREVQYANGVQPKDGKQQHRRCIAYRHARRRRSVAAESAERNVARGEEGRERVVLCRTTFLSSPSSFAEGRQRSTPVRKSRRQTALYADEEEDVDRGRGAAAKTKE